MIELVASLFIFLGSAFCLLAAIGVLRMPDLLIRMHAATKAGTLGISLILIGVAIYLSVFDVWLKAIVAIIFIFITNPIAAHMLARSAYFMNIPLWEGTTVDELREHYNQQTHELEDELD